MQVWECIVQDINWPITKRQVQKALRQFNITPCDLEDTVSILGYKPVCSHKCDLCLSVYLELEVNKCRVEVEEGQMCLF